MKRSIVICVVVLLTAAPVAWANTPLIEAVKQQDRATVPTLLDHGVDVNAQLKRKLWFRKFRYGDDWVDPNGATPFWRAAQANDIAAMRLLAARGADPNIATARG